MKTKHTFTAATLLGAISGTALIASGGAAVAREPRIECQQWPQYKFDHARCGHQEAVPVPPGGRYTS